MHERKIMLFILSLVAYCMYSVHMWFVKETVEEVTLPTPEPIINIENNQTQNDTDYLESKQKIVKKVIPLFMKDACSVLEVFTVKPSIKFKDIEKNKNKTTEMYADNNDIAAIGITVFLIILLLNAVLDVVKVKEEEKAKRKLNPDGERRQSLAEFANKKTLRRESSKFSLQLFQIVESVVNPNEEKENRRESRPYKRGDSTNSYLSERKTQTAEGSAPASISETPTGDARLVKRQSLAKIFGARPVPMVRRSSFPALPLNPDVQALMLGHRQPSFDSDDEGDGRGRRVRIIRRY